MGVLHRSFLISFVVISIAVFTVLYCVLNSVNSPQETVNRVLQLDIGSSVSSSVGATISLPRATHLLPSDFNSDTFLPFSPYSNTYLWDLFPPQVSCPDVERVGHLGDGGKWLCGLSSLSAVSRSCLVYSYGISTDASFEHTLASTGCIIHAFDPSVGDIPAAHKNSRIIFHKQGLANHTGHTASLMNVEHLLDTMARLNHTYIDILKVDIEGSEWDVFAELFSHLSSSNPLFGQLLIELHYATVKQTVQFFEGMKAAGYYSYSREVNLQPCVTGGLPVAVEYSFLHPKAFDTRRSSSVPIKPITTPQTVNGVIYYLTRHDRVADMSKSLQLLYENVYKLYMSQYPVLIFHDDLTTADVQTLQNSVPRMPLTFIVVEFHLPTHLQRTSIPDRTKCSSHSSTIGYRHMIMFHATWVHDYLLDPAHGYSHIDYIWRLDDDSRITSPIGYDLFQFMTQHNFLYGFVNTLADDALCIEGMWDFVRSFIKEQEIPDVLVSQFNNWTDGDVVYNNFEISRVTIWKHPLWRRFMSAVDQSGKVYTHRWGDAPIHTIIILLLLSPKQIHVFTDLPYRHLPFANQTAKGLPPPYANAFTRAHDCSYYNGWRCRNGTNITTTVFAAPPPSPLSPAWMQSVVFDDDNNDDVDDASPLNAIPKDENTAMKRKSAGIGVMYTFAHTGRVEKLTATLQSFYTNYILTFDTPLVVFLPTFMNITMLKMTLRQSLSEDLMFRLKFVHVDLDHFGYKSEASLPTTSQCGESNLEFKAASMFLASDAIDLLHRMGYVYFFRFADDSQLQRPISYDIFQYMIENNKVYGFVSIVKDNPTCVDGLWEAARHACESIECSSLLNEWPAGSVVYTNFEISHVSVWRAPVFVTMVMLLKQQLSEGDLSHVRWSDAAVHTIGVITGLKLSDIHNFVDIRYQANLPYASMVIPYSTNKWEPYTEMQRFISPRRFGWTGGDVGASFLLPSGACNSIDACDTSRYVWLFGDSFIGTSSQTRCVSFKYTDYLTLYRRIEGTMISNSVAIAQIDVKNSRMTSMKYFWKSTDDGRPLPIFESNEEDSVFWPYDGVSIFGKHGLKVVVLGQMSTKIKNQLDVNTAPEALSFALRQNVIHIVSNPYDLPELWSTEAKYFPASRYQWSSLAVTNGKRYGRDGDKVYFLGSYRPTDEEDELFGAAYHVLGRMRCSDILTGNIEKMAVLDGDGVWTDIDMLKRSPRQLFPLISSEASLHYNVRKMIWTITGLQLLTTDVVTCVASSLEAEWSCSKIAPVAESFRGRDYISYAARTHSELDTNTSTVVSYVTNFAGNPSELFQENHMGIYYPTFVKLFS